MNNYPYLCQSIVNNQQSTVNRLYDVNYQLLKYY